MNYPDSYSSSTNIALSVVNSTLRISSNGGNGAYEAFNYNINNSGVLSTTNINSNPKLYIKVKATGNPVLRIDIQDNAGFNTTVTTTAVTLGTNYTIYSLDYAGKFSDAGYGGSPCTSVTAPCPVNSSFVKKIVFFINPGTGRYNGTIDIDWISFGASLETIADYSIMYNQVSYFKGRDKIINFVSKNTLTPKNYKIYNSSNVEVMSGTSGASTFWGDGGLNVSKVDVSSLDIIDTYKLVTSDLTITFKVSNDAYAAIGDAAVKYYYYNRASSSVTSALGGEYARNAGHPDTSVLVHSSAASPSRPAGTVISAPKGWYDAGDYNKYIVNSGITTYTLLSAFEHQKPFYETKAYSLPEQGGAMPDLLDEIIWNLDWMVSMQDPNDGGVYHKLTEANFSGITMPQYVTSTRYVVQKSTAATLDFAAVAAAASRIFSNYESVKPGYSAALLAASIKAYTWAKNNPSVYFSNPSGINTGVYGDSNVSDEFRWAATELYIASGLANYKTDMNLPVISAALPYWGGVDALALYSITKNQSRFTPEEIALVTTKLTGVANVIKNKVLTSVMNISMSGAGDYNWGSNSTTCNQIISLITSYELTNEKSYLDAAYTAMDYLLGRNATGYTYVTGFGDKTPVIPHHRISSADAVLAPIPGMLVGGPNLARPGDCASYPANNLASSYLDDWCSYSTNEVAINWNAPLVYALNALQYYQNQSLLGVTSNELSLYKKTTIYPNPFKNTISVSVDDIYKGGTISIYSIEGKLLQKSIVNQNIETIDLSNLNKGIYFLKTIKGTNLSTNKIIKN